MKRWLIGFVFCWSIPTILLAQTPRFSWGTLGNGWSVDERPDQNEWYFQKQGSSIIGVEFTDMTFSSYDEMVQILLQEGDFDADDVINIQETINLNGAPTFHIAGTQKDEIPPRFDPNTGRIIMGDFSYVKIEEFAVFVNGQVFAIEIDSDAPDNIRSEALQIIRSFQFGGQAPVTAPERVRIIVHQATYDAEANQIVVSGAYESASEITSATIFRSMGGAAVQGHIQYGGNRFSATCPFEKGVPNEFKIVFDNKAQLSSEQTLTFSPEGTTQQQFTTGDDGNTRVQVPVVTPGLGDVGNIPGPSSLPEGAVGVLGPAVISLIASLWGGLFGGGGTTTVPPIPPKEKPKRSPEPSPKKQKEEDEEAETEEENEEKEEKEKTSKDKTSRDKQKNKDKNEPNDKKEEEKKDEEKKDEKKEEKEAKPPVNKETEEAQKQLDYLKTRPFVTKNPELQKQLAEAEKNCFGPDGNIIPEKWNELKASLKEAIEKDTDPSKDQSSLLGDVGRTALKTGVDFVKETGKAIKTIGVGIKDNVVAVYEGFKGLGYGIMNPKAFIRGLNDNVKSWMSANMPKEAPKQFQDALKEGRYLDALKVIAGTQLTLAGKALKGFGNGLWEFSKHMLPIEEIESIFSKHASWEERAWAVSATAVKIAQLILPTKWAKARVPGLGLNTTLIRSAKPGIAAIEASRAAATRAASLEKNIASLEKAAAKNPNKGGVQELLSRTKKALEKTKQLEASSKALYEVEQALAKANVPPESLSNFKAAQHQISKNPALQKLIDDAIKADQGGGSLYQLRLESTMGKDAHTLITARKLQLQETAVNNAVKRAIEMEVKRLQQNNLPIPKRFFTANSTEGSRVWIKGSNVSCDLDQTVLNMKYIRSKEMNRLIAEECKKLGFNQPTLDVNIYTPRPGRLMDAAGPAPNSEAWLTRSLQREPGRSGFHSVYVKNGKVYVSDHVSTQGSQALPLHKQLGKPTVLKPTEQMASVKTQLENAAHAAEVNNYNQVIKYGARAIKDGHPVSPETYKLIMNAAMEKDPHKMMELLRANGIKDAKDLLDRMNIPKH